ncbi:MAG: hypothetical protein ACM31O_01705 [Bacteroidota bacterium]
MFRMRDVGFITPLAHTKLRQSFRNNLKLTPVEDQLTLGAVAVGVTLEAYTTVLVSATSGAQFNLPDGEYVGQRKHLKAQISGSGTAVASASALSKLVHLAMSGETLDTIDALVLDANNEQVLLEWTVTGKWNVLYASSGVITVS